MVGAGSVEWYLSMAGLKWSPWLDFSQLYEYYGLVDDTGGPNPSRKIISYLGKTGRPHQDDGFRLRSNLKPSTGKQLDLATPLHEIPCPLSIGDLGCYWLRIEVPNKIVLDYIGQSAEKKSGYWGITKRLTEHFRKLCCIPDSSNLSWDDIRGVTPTRRFSEASKKIKELGFGDIADPKSEFFNKYIKIKLLIVPDTAHAAKTIHRIEGMAIAAYKQKYGMFPHLNERDETRGLDGFL